MAQPMIGVIELIQFLLMRWTTRYDNREQMGTWCLYIFAPVIHSHAEKRKIMARWCRSGKGLDVFCFDFDRYVCRFVPLPIERLALSQKCSILSEAFEQIPTE
eukprot:6466057-Amphidinium_carterae.1